MLRLSSKDPRWATLASTHPEAGPFHHPAWTQLIADVYGFESFVVGTEDDAGRLTAGLPVVEVPAMFGGRRWVSLPFTDHCRPLALDRPAMAALLDDLDAAREGTRSLRRIDIRAPTENWSRPSCAVLHQLRLTPDPEEVATRFHPSHVRRAIRRAERDGRVTVRVADRREDLTESFYGLHAETRRRQGTPVQPKRLFDLMWDRLHLGGLARTLVAELGGRPVAAAVFLSSNGTVMYKYGASDPEHWRERPNHLIFWRAIRDACCEGAVRVDFGRSDLANEGLRAFKSHWGADETPLVYSSIPDLSQGPAGVVPKTARSVLSTAIRRGPPSVGRAVGAVLYRYAA